MSLPVTIANDIRARIMSGTLVANDLLPATRVLAQQRGISRGSVVTAYEQLVGEGYLLSSPAGTRVNPDLPRLPHIPTQLARSTVEMKIHGDLRPGVPETGGLTSQEWRRAWRMAAAEPKTHPQQGSLKLRELLADHLRRSQSMSVLPEQIVVTLGARDGLRLILMATSGTVAVENPGYPTLHRVPKMLGRAVVPVSVDDQGISVEALKKLKPQVVLVMPNHQYPAGQQMAASRRFELIDWAKQTGATIVEDDYDSELRHTQPALAAADMQNTVALLGSFAKILTPALGLGYLVVPNSLRAEVLNHVLPVSGIVQDAMSNFLSADGLRKHTARMRREYRRRRAIFAEVFPAGIPMDGGLHAVIELAGNEADVLNRCQAQGLAVEGLGHYWSDADRAGIVIGLGAHKVEKLRAVLEELRTILGQQ